MLNAIDASDLGLRPGEWPGEIKYQGETWYKAYPLGEGSGATESRHDGRYDEPGTKWVLYRTRQHKAMRVYND